MWDVLEVQPANYETDKIPSDLPDGTVNVLKSMDFYTGTARALSNLETYFVPAAEPNALQYHENYTLRKICYFTASVIHQYDGTSDTDIKPASGLSGSTYWDTDAFGEWALCTNDVPGQVPHAINMAGAKLAPIPGWTATWDCFVIRTHRNVLFAANMVEGGQSYPNRVRWSSSAITGTLPSTWTPAPGNDAGMVDLEIPGGEITDMAAVGDTMYIGGPGGVWVARWVGGAYVYQFSARSNVNGPRKHRCMVSLGDMVAVLTRDDLVIMDEQTERSIMIGRNSSLIRSMTDARLMYIEATRQLYLFYTTNGTGYTHALIWDRDTNTFGERTFGKVYTATGKGMKLRPDVSPTWLELSPKSWLQWTGPWKQASYASPIYMLANASGVDLPGGAAWDWLIRRDNMPGPNGENIRVRSLELEIDGIVGQQVSLRLGYTNYPGESPSWGQQRTYTLGNGPLRHDDIVKGRYISWQASGTGNARIGKVRFYYRINATRP